MAMKIIRRAVVATLCLIGLSCLPAAGAPLPVSSGNLATFRSCTLTVRGNAAVEGFEAFVDQNSANANGNGSTIDVASNIATKNRRSYVQFDLSRCSPAIPSTATVNSATLRLYMSGLPNACRTHDIFRVASTWTETGITWNTQPFGTTLNNPPTGQRTASIDVGSAPCQNQTNGVYVSGWNVTADVSAYVNGTATNFGWMIRDDVEASATNRTGSYNTKNANNAVQSPQLIVNYTL
jgi:hypothetical protein